VSLKYGYEPAVQLNRGYGKKYSKQERTQNRKNHALKLKILRLLYVVSAKLFDICKFFLNE